MITVSVATPHWPVESIDRRDEYDQSALDGVMISLQSRSMNLISNTNTHLERMAQNDGNDPGRPAVVTLSADVSFGMIEQHLYTAFLWKQFL